MKISNAELKESFRQAQNISTYEIEKNLEAVELPELDFDWKSLYRQGKKRHTKSSKSYRRIMKIAVAAMFVAIVGVAVGKEVSMFAYTNPVSDVSWQIVWGDDVDEFLFPTDDGEARPPQEIETVYEPAYLPDGYKLTNEYTDKLSFLHEYWKGKEQKEQYIFLNQVTKNAGVGINSEDVERENVTINGYKGQINYGKKRGTLVWATEDYVFVITSSLGKEEIIKIAESLEKVVPKQ